MTIVCRRLARLAAAILLLFTGIIAGAAEQKVNPDLLALHARQEPGLVKVADRVYGAMFFEYSNFGFIVGDDGVIVIDSGWFPSGADMAMRALREITDKPIVALIYTHLHLDHTGGAGVILSKNVEPVPVYGPVGWQRWVSEAESALAPTIFRRVYLQMGMVLPRGEDGTVGNGLGPSPIPEPNKPLAHPPTIEVSEPMELTLAGVRIQILPMAGDMPEHQWVWLPDDKVLFVGDAPPHGVFPAVETARFEIDRDPQALLGSVETALALEPEYIIPGHSRMLQGWSDVEEVMNVNRDAITWLVDQVDRYYLSDRSVEELLFEQRLPEALANHPDIQPAYHRWEWMVRQRYLKRAGFIDESMDYLSLTDIDEAQRLVPLLGGRERVLALATQLAETDPRWAARLATYLLHMNSEDAEAAAARQAAFLAVAQTTLSANERNYLLGLIREERGEVDFDVVLAPRRQATYAKLGSEEILLRMKTRFRTEDAKRTALTVTAVVDGTTVAVMRVRNGVLYVESADIKLESDATLRMSRATLDSLGAGSLSWEAAIGEGKLQISGDTDIAKQLAALIE